MIVIIQYMFRYQLIVFFYKVSLFGLIALSPIFFRFLYIIDAVFFNHYCL